MNSLIARPADALAAPQLARANAIYEDAFAAHLRVPFAELARTGRSDALYIALDGDTPVGFAALRLLDSVGWVFLRYFAIAAERRRERLGRRMWDLLHDCLVRDSWPSPICFEVEDPEQAVGDKSERQVREGRVAFWESCGATRLPVPGYMMPGVAWPTPPEPVLLMAPATAAASADASQLAGLVRAIYSQRYGLAHDDSLVRQAVASIGARPW